MSSHEIEFTHEHKQLSKLLLQTDDVNTDVLNILNEVILSGAI